MNGLIGVRVGLLSSFSVVVAQRGNCWKSCRYVYTHLYAFAGRDCGD